ncbi:MAG: TlpA family protein disulfide reductase [Candidatus Aureabacteria bacterium]|nr:TlpA family protein disulfide reductase [Candidatus Auribacterota bacterium]
MKNFSCFKIIIFFFLLLSLSSCSLAGQPISVKDFTLKSVNGEDVTLSQLKGKVVLLVFGFSRCPFCMQEIPYLNKLHEEYKDKPFQVLYVNITEGENMVKSLVRDKGIMYTTLIDREAKTASSYRIVGVPANFLINKDQTSIERVDVFKDIREKINALL